MSERVFFVSEDSAAYADTESGMAALESLGYHRCSREQYDKAIQRISKSDGMEIVGEVMRHLEAGVRGETKRRAKP